MRRRVVALLLVCLAAGLAGCSVDVVIQSPAGDASQSYNVTVTNVVDGDTIDVRYANGSTDRVRLIGIDTPEVHVETEPEDWEGIPDTDAGHQCLRNAGENASAYVGEAIAGREVRLQLDAVGDTRGSYGRLLAYVYVDGDNLNYRLVSEGYAAVYPAEFEQQDRFEAAEDDAIAASAGTWTCQRLG
ncbi:thermonuclease family protein [Halobacteriales archaeon Cl-PHB]